MGRSLKQMAEELRNFALEVGLVKDRRAFLLEMANELEKKGGKGEPARKADDEHKK